jgi:serine protease inhibitor
MRMRNELRAAAGAAMAALLIAGCGSNPASPVMAHGVAAREPLADPRPYGSADAALGLDALGAWCRAAPQANLVLSPSSLASGLGMAYLGARGGTAQALASVLHLPASGGQRLEAGLQARSAALRRLSGPGVTLSASAQVWADPTLPTKRSYLNAVASAVVADGWTAVRLPYRGGRLVMEALLPPAGSAGCALPAGPALGAMTSRLDPGQPGTLTRSVEFPKVSLATHISMRSLLTQLGMGVAFSPAADFTGPSPQACCIGLVEQAATLDIG